MVVSLIALAFVYPVVRVLKRMGFARWWALFFTLLFFPIIGLWILAFAKWPNCPKMRMNRVSNRSFGCFRIPCVWRYPGEATAVSLQSGPILTAIISYHWLLVIGLCANNQSRTNPTLLRRVEWLIAIMPLRLQSMEQAALLK